MFKQDILYYIGQLFVHQDEGIYQELISQQSWQSFLDAVFVLHLDITQIEQPLTYQMHSEFCRKHFTGGLPASALPVESLNPTLPINNNSLNDISSPSKGAYLSDSALYMRDVISSLGFVIPKTFNACPDHLSLECEIARFLFENGLTHDAEQFIDERFTWLEAYKQKLNALNDTNKAFFIGLVSTLQSLSQS